MRTFILCLFLTSCSSLHQSSNELNKRSDMPKSSLKMEKIEKQLAPKKLFERVPSRVERIWVYDQIIDGKHWLKGSWYYIEIEGSKWGISDAKRPF